MNRTKIKFLRLPHLTNQSLKKGNENSGLLVNADTDFITKKSPCYREYRCKFSDIWVSVCISKRRKLTKAMLFSELSNGVKKKNEMQVAYTFTNYKQ